MFSTVEDIKNKIKMNSRDKVTYIHPIKGKREIAKLIAGYSNTNGGDIVFGIRDDGRRLEIKNFPYQIKLKQYKDLIDNDVLAKETSITLDGVKLYYISVEKSKEKVKINGDIYIINDNGRVELFKEQKLFLSYCWADEPIADVVDKDFQELGYTLARDVRGIKFKDSIKDFMESIGEHDYVISVISSKYLKSINCMYEISEVMRSRKYKDKMLLIILDESDQKYLSSKVNPSHEFVADIYSFEKKIHYIEYWEAKKEEYNKSIERITEGINKIESLNELKRVTNISNNISEFLSEISDWKNYSFSELKETDYEPFLKEINKTV